MHHASSPTAPCLMRQQLSIPHEHPIILFGVELSPKTRSDFPLDSYLHHLGCTVQVGNDNFNDVLAKIRGAGSPAIAEWQALQEDMRPLARAASMIPPAALRFGETRRVGSTHLSQP